MSLITTITSNPDFAILVSGLVGYLGKQLWNKSKEKGANELWDTMLKVAYQAFPALLRDARVFDDDYVREYMTKKIWSGLTRLEIPKNATTLKLVGEVVEHAYGELSKMVVEHMFQKLKTDAIPVLEASLAKLQAAQPEVVIGPTP